MAIFAKRQHTKEESPSTEGVSATAESTSGETTGGQEVAADSKIAASAGGDAQANEAAGAGSVAAVAVKDAPPGGGESEIAEAVEIEPEAIEPLGTAGPTFGIAETIQLMRSLPSDPNVELLVRVVRVTLGAVNVSIEDIIQDAVRKEEGIKESIKAQEAQVAELEKQLYARRCEIAAFQADLKETASVRERLYHADKYKGHGPPPMPPDAARVAIPLVVDWQDAEDPKAD